MTENQKVSNDGKERASQSKVRTYPDGYKNMIVRTYKAAESGNGSTDMHSKAGIITIP